MTAAASSAASCTPSPSTPARPSCWRCSASPSCGRRTRSSPPSPMAWARSTFVALALREPDPRTVAKKPLVVTERARRILIAGRVVLAVAAVAPLIVLTAPLIAWIIPVQAIPFTLVVGNLILKPFEARVQQQFWTEAHDKLATLKPTTYRHHRLVRQDLGQAHPRPPVVAAGADVGDAGQRQHRDRHRPHRARAARAASPLLHLRDGRLRPRLGREAVQLAPPDVAIVTAIGAAHDERFKSLDTVAKAKFELPAAARAHGGTTVPRRAGAVVRGGEGFPRRRRATR